MKDTGTLCELIFAIPGADDVLETRIERTLNESCESHWFFVRVGAIYVYLPTKKRITMICVVVFAWLRQNVRMDQITCYAYVSHPLVPVRSRECEPRWRESRCAQELG